MKNSGPIATKIISLLCKPAEGSSNATTLIDGDRVEVIRMCIGSEAEHVANKHKGEALVFCLSGRVSISVEGETQQLESGHMFHIIAHAPYVVRGVADVSVLATINPHPVGSTRARRDEVDQAAVESFPASDPPAFTSSTAVGAPSRSPKSPKTETTQTLGGTPIAGIK